MKSPSVQRPMRAVSLAILLISTTAAATKVGDRAADLTLKDLSGDTVKLSSLKGSVIVLDFWASWCGPCKKELPALDKLAKTYDGKPVVFLAISVDKDRKNAEKFLGSAAVSTLRILFDPDGKSATAFDLPTMPSSFVIDQKGLVRHIHAGYSGGDEKKIAAEVDALLK